MMRADLDVKQIVRELKEKGVVCLRSFFDTRTVEKMREEAVALLTAREAQDLRAAAGRKCVKIRPKVLRAPRFPSLGQAFNSNLFREIAFAYDAKCFFESVVVDCAARSSAKLTDVHFDTVRSLKFMIYLSDIDKESAAFRYCLGSHNENLKLRKRFLLMGGRVADIPNVPGPGENYVLQDMEGRHGTLIIFDTEGFHSAGNLQNGKQRMLIRSSARLSVWSGYKVLRRVAAINPLRVFLPLLVPEGRAATFGTSLVKSRAPH